MLLWHQCPFCLAPLKLPGCSKADVPEGQLFLLHLAADTCHHINHISGATAEGQSNGKGGPSSSRGDGGTGLKCLVEGAARESTECTTLGKGGALLETGMAK